MLKSEIERIVGREIPNSIYLELESERMKSGKDTIEFLNNYFPEEIDKLICRKYFEMEMKVIEAEGRILGYQRTMARYHEQDTADMEIINKYAHEAAEANRNVQRKDMYIKSLNEEIQKLKAELYDKGI